MQRFTSSTPVFAIFLMLCSNSAHAEHQTDVRSVSSNVSSSVYPRAVRAADANGLGAMTLAQRSEPDRPQREETQEEIDNRKAALEEARLAPICDPLKTRAVSILGSAGTSPGPFNQALASLREIGKQLSGSCPQQVTVFEGSVVNIIPCYNESLYVELSDGGRFVLTKDTRTLKSGSPQAKGERIMGLTDAPYYCIKSTSPLEVWPAKHIDAMARRNYDATDRDLLSADLARRRAHEIAELEIQITDYNQKLLTNPQDIESLGHRGIAYLQRADYAHAVADFNTLISLQPETALWWNDRCYALVLENRDVRKAISDCDKALQLEPTNAYTLDSRGYAYLRLGELDKSIADFNAALKGDPQKVDPQLASSLYGRGLAKRKKGNVAGGDVDVAEARKINADIAEQFAIHGIK